MTDVRANMFVRIDTDPVTRFCFGLMAERVAPDAVETEGGLYLGLGILLNRPTLAILMDGTAAEQELGLRGVDDIVLDMLDGVRGQVTGRAMAIGYAEYDADYKLGPIDWRSGMEVSQLRSRERASGDRLSGQAREHSVYLRYGLGDPERRRANGGVISHASAAPGDTFYSFLNTLSQGIKITFPPKKR